MATGRIILPELYRKLIVNRLTNNFREATVLKSVPLPHPNSGEVIVRNRFAGINASDINYTAGKYDPTKSPPFDAGFEGVGEVVAIGSDDVKHKIGQPVVYMKYGAFSEYIQIDSKHALPIPELKPEFLTLPVSGCTAAIALDKVGEIQAGETVLVTAAAGGTGQFAVQWAKKAGCHVIGTCSSDEKVTFLKSIGCDRAINYKTENLFKVLRAEYPKGVDVVYESVGGETFRTALSNLARKGRLIVIGYVSGYKSESGFGTPENLSMLPMRLLGNSSSVRGFFLFHFFSHLKEYSSKLAMQYLGGNISIKVDNGEKSDVGPFKGIESIPEAVDYLYTGKNVGKVYVDLGVEKSKL